MQSRGSELRVHLHDISLELPKFCEIIITARQRSCGKVLFLQASVNLFTGGGG